MTPHHTWSPSPEIIKQACVELDLTVVEADDSPDHYYSFYVRGKL
jgi:hypothetical protein